MLENLNGFVFKRVQKVINTPMKRRRIEKVCAEEKSETSNFNGFVFRIGKKQSEKGEKKSMSEVKPRSVIAAKKKKEPIARIKNKKEATLRVINPKEGKALIQDDIVRNNIKAQHPAHRHDNSKPHHPAHIHDNTKSQNPAHTQNNTTTKHPARAQDKSVTTPTHPPSLTHPLLLTRAESNAVLNDYELQTPKKSFILSKIKEPTPFRFDKNDFLDIKTPKKSIFYSENFLINSKNQKRPSIFDHARGGPYKNIDTQEIEEESNNQASDENELSKNIKSLLKTKANIFEPLFLECIENYFYENLNKKIESEFLKFIEIYKKEIENVKNEIEKWKKIKENLIFENDYFFDNKNLKCEKDLKNYKKNESFEKEKKMKNNFEFLKVLNEKCEKYKRKIKENENELKNEIKNWNAKIYKKMEIKNKMDPVFLCKALSRI